MVTVALLKSRVEYCLEIEWVYNLCGAVWKEVAKRSGVGIGQDEVAATYAFRAANVRPWLGGSKEFVKISGCAAVDASVSQSADEVYKPSLFDRHGMLP